MLFAACRKDPIVVGGCEVERYCVPVPAAPSLAGWNYRYDPHWIKDARFDPNDPGRILFTDAPYGGYTRQVYRFDLQTQQRNLVFEGAVIFPSEWAGNDWVVINVLPGMIYKIKATGDSLTQLTLTGGYYAPVLDKERTRVGYHTAFQHSGIIDLNGNQLDSLPYPCGFIGASAWRSENVVAEIYCDGVELNNIVECTREVIAPLPENSSGCGAGITYLNETTLIWSDSQGVFTTDVNTRKTKCIVATCNSSFYLGLSYDPVGGDIITVRMDKEPDGYDLLIHSTLVIMKADGSGMREIAIPW